VCICVLVLCRLRDSLCMTDVPISLSSSRPYQTPSAKLVGPIKRTVALCFLETSTVSPKERSLIVDMMNAFKEVMKE
jgi:hypothetical protein